MHKYREQAVWGKNMWNSHIHFRSLPLAYQGCWLGIHTRRRGIAVEWRWKPVPLWRFLLDSIGVSWNRFPVDGRIDEVSVSFIFLGISIGV